MYVVPGMNKTDTSVYIWQHTRPYATVQVPWSAQECTGLPYFIKTDFFLIFTSGYKKIISPSSMSDLSFCLVGC